MLVLIDSLKGAQAMPSCWCKDRRGWGWSSGWGWGCGWGWGWWGWDKWDDWDCWFPVVVACNISKTDWLW